MIVGPGIAISVLQKNSQWQKALDLFQDYQAAGRGSCRFFVFRLINLKRPRPWLARSFEELRLHLCPVLCKWKTQTKSRWWGHWLGTARDRSHRDTDERRRTVSNTTIYEPARVWGKAQNSRCDHHSDCGDQHYLLCGGREAFSDKPKQGDVTWGAGRERKATPNVRRWELDLRVSKSNSVQTQTSIFHFSNFEDKTKVLDNNQQLRHRNFSAKQPMKARLLSSGLNPKMRWYLKLGFHFSMNFHQYEFLNTFFVIVNLSFFFCFWANQTLFLAVCCTSKVVPEEQTSQGPADSNPMTLFELVLMLERKGILDTKITGHGVDRPPSVKRGEETDRLEVVHESYSLFKPDAVTIKTAKSTNIAGLAGYKVLSASNYLVLVWRLLEHH